MVVELIGGPLDGAVLQGPEQLTPHVVINGHQDGPVYRIGCCQCCAGKRKSVPYLFLGYEQAIKYEYPEKSQNIQALEQKAPVVSDTQAIS